MNEGNSRSEFSSFQNGRKDADSVGTKSSATTRSGRNEENLQPTKTIRSIQCILDFPNRPSWLPEDTWNYNADTSHPSQCSDQSYNKFDETNNNAWCTHDPFETRDLSPRSYDSHSSRNVVNRKYAQNSCYDKPIKFDRWVNEEPTSEIREQNFYSTQLIRQTTRDADKKVVWIYSYKNPNLFPDESNSDCTASTDRSDKEYAEESLWRRSAFPDVNSSFMETRDERRQLNDRNMYNVPTHKLFERSLETVEEAESEKSCESPGQVKNLRLHRVASGESFRSVKWTDGSASDSVNLPGETTDRNSAVYVEVHRKKERIDVRKSVESSVSEDKNMNLADWEMEKCYRVVHQRDDATEWKTSNVQDKCVNTDNTGQTISVPARWNLRPYSWEVYYPTSPQPDSELVNISYADTEKKGMWHMLSRCFCKCV